MKNVVIFFPFLFLWFKQFKWFDVSIFAPTTAKHGQIFDPFIKISIHLYSDKFIHT